MTSRILKSIFYSSLMLGSALFLQGCQDQPQSDHVAVSGGLIQGQQQGRVIAYKGIPYAAPPVGNLRWRAPQPVTKWQGVKVLENYAPDCMQKPFAGDAAPLATTPSEDCLYLNVFKPAKHSDSPYPVVVWIHGGGFVNGGASPAVYSGESFAKQGVIFVSFNYRLGRFGFFAHPALTRFENDALGNYALMDQIAALEWVKKNIAQFGGDASKVTLMGESAGGASVHAMMQTPAANNLFQQAIIMSAGGRDLFKQRPLHSNDDTVLSAEQIGENFAKQHTILGSDENALAALRELPAKDIIDDLNLSTLYQQNTDVPNYVGGPIIDGTIISASTETRLRKGTFSHIPAMVGTTDRDLGFAGFASKDALFDSFAGHSTQARMTYDANGDTPLPMLNYQIGQDAQMQEPARFVAKRISDMGKQAYLYRFGYVAQTLDKPGAEHASEIPYFFNTVQAKYGHVTTEQDKQAAKIMHRYVTNFIKLGTPNGPGLPKWSAFKHDEPFLLQMNKAGTAEFLPDPLQARLNITEAKAEQQ